MLVSSLKALSRTVCSNGDLSMVNMLLLIIGSLASKVNCAYTCSVLFLNNEKLAFKTKHQN